MYRGNFNNRLRIGVVYTDGACIRNGQPGASAGWGYFWPKSGIEDHGHLPGIQQTNNRAELFAVYKALQSAHDQEHRLDKVIIRTDSDLLVKTMTIYINKWKNNNWKRYDGKPVKNRDVVELIDSLESNFQEVVYEHVPAHNGVHGNERADFLAKQGARMSDFSDSDDSY
ncbi:unnamed protein product [Caenorhabditis angaria]|uniref:ribonuclease H n=1 Tax=Caenorhabditis angaria TaxID=860376 RepID=A0A9P1IJU5_9PELO|nr:unnamed protein product [Caenorhabditis angaria]